MTSAKVAEHMVDGFFRQEDSSDKATLSTALQNMIDNIEAIFDDEAVYDNDIRLTTAIKVGYS